MEAFMLGIAINLVSTLMVAGSERLRTAALGNDQEQALEEAFTGATAAMLVEVARQANHERELPGRLEEQFHKFFGDQLVAETLVSSALNSEVPPTDRLRQRFGELDLDAEALSISFERAMSLFARELAVRLRENARSGGPLASIVVVADVEAMRSMLEILVQDWGEDEQEMIEPQSEFLARQETAWTGYKGGPKSSNDDVLFAGFFVPSGPQGRLTHGGNTSSMEVLFFDTFSGTMAEHRLNSTGLIIPNVHLPIRAVDRRPPEGFAEEAQDYEGFTQLVSQWAERCLGVVWGTLREDGKIERFEVAVDPRRYYGGPLYERGLERIRRVSEQDELPHRAVVRYLAKALAAIWCQGYCDVLNRLGRWEEAIPVVSDSERLLREALEELEEDAGVQARATVKGQRKALLPQVIRQEAASLWYSGQRYRALGRLFEAIKLDPWGPIGSRERFREYYNNRYAFSLASNYDKFDDFLAARYGKSARTDKDRTSTYAGRAFTQLPPLRPTAIRGLDFAGHTGRRGSLGKGRGMVL